MGNSFACFSPPLTKKSPPPKDDHHLPPWIPPSSSSSQSKNEVIFDEAYIKQQAQIASMLYKHHLQNNTDLLLHLDRSVSTKNPPKNKNKLSRKSHSVSSSNPLSMHLSAQEIVARNDGQDKKHFVLVHGGGLGVWCWYKIIALLKEDNNCEVDAIDLNGSGLQFCDINSIKTIQQYSKPLIDFLSNLAHNKEVILVGHDIGGACISYAMELFPSKVSKAVFVAATMLSNDQSALDIFSHKACLSDLHQNAQKFIYANGKKNQPTAIAFDESLLQDFLFNRTPSKDIALASVSMRAVPFVPLTEKLSLSAANYGSISRFYIKTEDDIAIPKLVQEAMIESNPPKEVFEMKGSDHSPFFSRPRALHRILMEISNLPPK